MNVWPLIHRELLVGARRRSNYWLRVPVALTATIVGGLYVPIINQQPTVSAGWSLFVVLVWLALATSGLFGVFFASDVISSERREGTLGLLFLTRLRGVDVVIGKFFSTSLRAAFSLLAAAPLLALPLLLGGVTFLAFSKSALVLANTLFLSSAAGLMISSFNRNPVRAVIGTVITIMLLAGGTFLIDLWLTGQLNEGDFVARLCHVSPVFAMTHATTGNSNSLYAALATQHVIGWLFLIVAAWRTAEHSEKVRTERRSGRLRWRMTAKEPARRRRLREKQPLQWLVSHRSRGPTIIALIVIAIIGIILAAEADDVRQRFWASSISSMISAVNALFGFVLFVWLAVESARRTGDSKTSGALELILSTPLTDREVVSGFCRGVLRVFFIPIVTIVLLRSVSSLLTMIMLQQYESPRNFNEPLHLLVGGIIGIAAPVSTCIALIWVGTWLGLRSERTTGAAALTFVTVVVVPVFLVQVGTIMMFSFFQVFINSPVRWLYSIAPGGLTLLVNVAFVVWARRRLLGHFREAANGTLKRRTRAGAPSGRGHPPALPS